MDILITPALAECVKRERQQYGLTLEVIRDRGGPSQPTMTKIEAGEGSLSAASARKLEHAFGWVPDAVRVAAAGGVPERRDTAPTTLQAVSEQGIEEKLSRWLGDGFESRFRTLGGVQEARDRMERRLRTVSESIADLERKKRTIDAQLEVRYRSARDLEDIVTYLNVKEAEHEDFWDIDAALPEAAMERPPPTPPGESEEPGT